LPNAYLSQEVRGIFDDIDTHRIRHPSHQQLRTKLNGIEELTASIRQKGLLQPIIVRVKEDYYEIVAGNRRYEACKNLHWKKIPCHIIEIEDKEAFEISIIENVQRETLSPIEEAEAFKNYVSDFGWGGVSELASKMGKSVSYVTKRIKLLNLPTEVLDSITNRNVSISVAEELSFVKDPSRQTQLAELISKRHLSLRKIRNMIKDSGNGGSGAFDDDDIIYENRSEAEIQRLERSFDKSIIMLRIAMNKLGTIIENTEDSWLVYNILMEQKATLNWQIDQLIKAKKKFIASQRR
jgi:ParB family transcriptional regulator, chromosome partitioning protein